MINIFKLPFKTLSGKKISTKTKKSNFGNFTAFFHLSALIIDKFYIDIEIESVSETEM